MPTANHAAESGLINRHPNGFKGSVINGLLDIITNWLQTLYGKQQSIAPIIGNPESLKKLQLLQASKRSEPTENKLIYRPDRTVEGKAPKNVNIWRGDFKFVAASTSTPTEGRPGAPHRGWQNLLFNQEASFKG